MELEIASSHSNVDSACVSYHADITSKDVFGNIGARLAPVNDVGAKISVPLNLDLNLRLGQQVEEHLLERVSLRGEGAVFPFVLVARIRISYRTLDCAMGYP